MKVFSFVQCLITIVWFSTLGTGNSYGQHIQIDTLGSYIEFGTGGGFTGLQQGYLLTKQGALFSTQRSVNNIQKTTFIKELKKKDVIYLFKSAQKIAMSKVKFNEPGNTYSYIYYKNDHISNQYVWGNSSKPTPKKILNLSSKLAKTITP